MLVTVASLLLPLVPELLAGRGLARHRAAPPRVIFPPAIAAVSLGIVGHARLHRADRPQRDLQSRRQRGRGRDRRRLAAYLFGPTVVFYLLAAMAIASLVSVLAIPESAIDHDLARGLHDAEQGDRAGKESSRRDWASF